MHTSAEFLDDDLDAPREVAFRRDLTPSFLSKAEPFKLWCETVFDFAEREDMMPSLSRDDDGAWSIVLKARDAQGFYSGVVTWTPMLKDRSEDILAYRQRLFTKCSRAMMVEREIRQNRYIRAPRGMKPDAMVARSTRYKRAKAVKDAGAKQMASA